MKEPRESQEATWDSHERSLADLSVADHTDFDHDTVRPARPSRQSSLKSGKVRPAASLT